MFDACESLCIQQIYLGREVRANPRHDVNDTEDDNTHERRTKARHDVNVAANDNTHGARWGKRAKKDYPNLKHRTSPLELHNSISQLTIAQKQAVRDLGFGSILNLQIKDVPPKRVHVAEDDVRLMFGFPRGQRKIEKPSLIETSDVIKGWRSQFERPLNRIRVDVCIKMLEDREGGIWFKKHFLVLLSFFLIESYGNSYVLSHILDCFEDVDRASDFNWCAHVLKCLIEHTTSWKENTNKYFTGPTLFITKGCTEHSSHFGMKRYDDLRRQNMEIVEGGFGQGYCDGPCREEDVVGVVPGRMQQENEANVNVNVNEGVPPVVEPDACRDINENDDEQLNPMNTDVIDDLSDIHAVSIGLLKQGKVISDALSTIMATVRKLPPGMLDNVAFRKTVEASMMVSRQEQVIHGESSLQPTPTQDDMDFWNNPEHIAAILEIEKAAMEREQLQKELCSMPSFSLGLTQEWDGIVNLARDAVELAKKEAGLNTDVHGTPHRPESSIMEDTSDVGRRNEDAMGVNEQDIENAGNVADITEKVDGKMTTRCNNLIRKTNVLVSPFIVRPIVASDKLDLKQKKLFYWIVENDESDLDEVVYSDSIMEFRRRELMSICPNQYLSSAVLDVWSVIMNHNEKLRAPNSTTRFFATTYICLGTVVDALPTWDYEKRSTTFADRLISEIGNVSGLQLDKIDMVRFFKDFLRTTGHAKIATTMDKKLKTMDMLKMAWRNETNEIDCGIYVMRHMETYKGGSLRQWNSGLMYNNDKQMRYLRAKYCAAILSADSNIHKDRIIAQSSFHYRKSCGDGPLNIDAIIMKSSNTK
ncbi:hypothetical protein C2S53_009581 [Perilla frutescens var. hirtella]|uniref:Ubiquitin-like protease family profile domain-containing protein n=1 Tax=Perilla frutescens var. hirtella TaxID=608512 RepID=A0AAD4JQ59_PERFH|nr:hypothetical protein C2S53_009581 [Perilla frutescens var. hirtella]